MKFRFRRGPERSIFGEKGQKSFFSKYLEKYKLQIVFDHTIQKAYKISTFLKKNYPNRTNGLDLTDRQSQKSASRVKKITSKTIQKWQKYRFLTNFLNRNRHFFLDFMGGYYSTFGRKMDSFSKKCNFWSKIMFFGFSTCSQAEGANIDLEHSNLSRSIPCIKNSIK